MSSVLSRFLDTAVDETASSGPPGACLALATAGSERAFTAGYRQVFGDAGLLASPLPMTAATVHDVGSVTKVLGTTAALMTLVDGDQLTADDPVARFVPRWRGTDRAGVTIGDLLQHRAGLWEWWPTYLTATDRAEALRVVTDLPLRHRPRAGRHYSDLGFITLGAVVESVTGRSLREAVHALVLRPLGLHGVRYGGAPDAEVAAGAAGDAVERHMIDTGRPYPVTGSTSDFAGWRDGVRVGEVDDGNAYHAFGGVAGHAGLFATAADLLTFGRHLLDSLAGGGYWSERTVRGFLRRGPDSGQALGFRAWTLSGEGGDVRAYGHTGFPGVAFAVLPAYDATVVLLTNRLHVTAPPPPAPYEPRWLRALSAARQHLADVAGEPQDGRHW